MGDLPGGRSVFEAVDERLLQTSHDPEVKALWAELRAAFDDGGPDYVVEVIKSRVRTSSRLAKNDLKGARAVARTTAPPKRTRTATRSSRLAGRGR